ncbi:hypothetical protein ACF1AY_18745 [Streptomyces sp. NPDC014776]|uniref:hypothetical protein n=1 Tax=Streptomyces sp. NPDC014776 TaxID=3364909 RepID=UPI0036F55C60
MPRPGNRPRQHTTQSVSGCIEQLMDIPEPGAVAYRTDEEHHAANPDSEFPASWHRACAARIAQEVPALPIAYADQGEHATAAPASRTPKPTARKAR